MANWKDSAARTLNRILNRFGLQISHYSSTSLQAAFDRLSQRPVPINTIIDIGASDGRWSEEIYRYYPDAFYLMIDANSVHEQALQGFKHRFPNSDYVIAAAGNEEGVVNFSTADALGGVAVPYAVEGVTTQVPMTTVDALVKQKGLQPPFLIKLDTHGFEVPILEGARETLPETSMVVMETYNFPVLPGALKFYEMCAHMETLGFRPIDLIDPMHRPLDSAFWQVDLLFIRADREEFQHIVYS